MTFQQVRECISGLLLEKRLSRNISFIHVAFLWEERIFLSGRIVIVVIVRLSTF